MQRQYSSGVTKGIEHRIVRLLICDMFVIGVGFANVCF